MALFKEEEVKASGIFIQNDLNKLTPDIGDSIGFFLFETDERSGEEGKFQIWNGLRINLESASIEKMVETAEPINFIPRMILEKKLEEGSMALKGCYRLEKSINRGDNYKGKKVRYYAWNVFTINAPEDAIEALNAKVLELQGKGSALGTETKAMPIM